MSRSEGTDGRLFDAIFNSVGNTMAESHRSIFNCQVRHAYHLEKPSQKLSFMPFEKKVHNKFLMWYGCRQSSTVATLREGIRLQAPEVPTTSLRYGRGIYLTDCFSKAAVQSIDLAALTEDGTP